MVNGLLTGFLRLKNTSENLAGAILAGRTGGTNHADHETLSEHDLRDLGMLDGRVSPSTVERCVRSNAWHLIDLPPHSL